MSRYLLDASVLIPLEVPGHEHHALAEEWARESRDFALCPVVEGALVCFLIRNGAHRVAVQELLRRMYASGRYVFRPDSLSYADSDLSSVIGHRQVTDAYLVSLAGANGTPLATMDQGLARAYPADTELVR